MFVSGLNKAQSKSYVISRFSRSDAIRVVVEMSAAGMYSFLYYKKTILFLIMLLI